VDNWENVTIPHEDALELSGLGLSRVQNHAWRGFINADSYSVNVWQTPVVRKISSPFFLEAEFPMHSTSMPDMVTPTYLLGQRHGKMPN
jgi:hypothetical protein